LVARPAPALSEQLGRVGTMAGVLCRIRSTHAHINSLGHTIQCRIGVIEEQLRLLSLLGERAILLEELKS